MLTQDFHLKLKGAPDETGAFIGIASPYGDPPDLMGDVIEAGAYAQAIRQQGQGYPLLWSHRGDEPLGIARISDSQPGLVVNGQLLMDDAAAQRVHKHLLMGSVKGLSIGFTIPRGEGKVVYRDDGVRVLKEIRLHEISVVACPAAGRALVTSVKTLSDVRHMLQSFRPDQVDEDAIADLREIDRELKRLLLPAGASDELLELRRFAAELAA